jgi:3,4-dihydroxy-2-butanone 4-phosphate synthase
MFDSIEDAIKAFRDSPSLGRLTLISAGKGEFLVVMDDESRENEGDLMLPAQFATTEKFAFLVRHSRYLSSRTSSSDVTHFRKWPRLFTYHG